MSRTISLLQDAEETACADRAFLTFAELTYISREPSHACHAMTVIM